jgi:hypothetical protein
MKNTKCKVISEFKGQIACYTINDHDTYYMIKLAIDLITDKLRRVKIKKQKDFVKDIVIGLLGLKIVEHIQPADILNAVSMALLKSKDNDLQSFKPAVGTNKISEKVIYMHLSLVTERIKSGYYMR